ncbi:hypothetical protein KP509_12G031900 [Ceratopteris richardii]|uniref:Uncharacterized protein n=1 Tax=Ceratopteris richardii TaxID=49495 RepID=A0A8T2TQU3_CERRI|nr:hypothetical protein KP509_12G031900 [Ceratopteris richardii]KAH7422919.1 hypothetical protein KP509_12G031900 [Ceratopteris richardii]KAH7422920.1 hypothetical protein KP509_12G031900 [Ceratopteris richardii]
MSTRVEFQEVEVSASFAQCPLSKGPLARSSFDLKADSTSVISSTRLLNPRSKNLHCEPTFCKQARHGHRQPHKDSYVGGSSSSQALHGDLGTSTATMSVQQAARNNRYHSGCINRENSESFQTCATETVASCDPHLSRSNPKYQNGRQDTSSKPISLVTGIFKCWSKNRQSSGSFQHSSASKQRLDSKPSTNILLQQTRLQQEALAETNDTRDMWEWHMEQQQDITSQEHSLLERNSLKDPRKVFPDSIGNSLNIKRNEFSLLGQNQIAEEGSCSSLEQEKSCNHVDREDGSNLRFIQGKLPQNGTGDITIHRESNSLTWDEYSELATTWQNVDFVSTMMLLFESAFLRCRAEVAYFCRVYMQQMILSGYALIRTLMEMEPNTIFSCKVHASYALEARVHTVMFRCFESDSFDDSGITHILEPRARAAAYAEDYVRMKGTNVEEALKVGSATYEEAFYSYCASKSEEVMNMFSWMSIGYRNSKERDRFMEAFLRAAKWVWLLHRLANSMHPPLRIFRVKHGHVIDPVYIESVSLPSIGSRCPKCPSSSPPKVEFMIMPGFISPSGKIFRCKAYQHYRCKQ